MKTIEQIDREISQLLSSAKQEETQGLFGSVAPVVTKKIKGKIEFLREVKKYLETNPTQEFVTSEIKRLEGLLVAHRENW